MCGKYTPMLVEKQMPRDEVNACLNTVEGVRWTMSPEEKIKRTKTAVSDPHSLL
jgi:hypothetical protein